VKIYFQLLVWLFLAMFLAGAILTVVDFFHANEMELGALLIIPADVIFAIFSAGLLFAANRTAKRINSGAIDFNYTFPVLFNIAAFVIIFLMLEFRLG